MAFAEALQALLDGKRLGIRPGENVCYVELWRPSWKRSGWQLRWTMGGEGINVEQYLGTWRLEVIDHRTLLVEADHD